MPKMTPWFLGIFLAALGLWAPTLCAEDSFSDVAPALSAASGTSEETKREDVARDETMYAEATPKEVTSKEAMSTEAMPQEAVTEGATPGVDSAVVAAQQEVSDPFAMALDTAGPVNATAAGPAQPVGPPVTVELQGIGFGSKDAYAIIGGEVFFTGDQKNGIKLVEVRRREVDIIVNGGPMTCPLFPDQDVKNAKEREKRKRAVSASSADLKAESSSSMPQGEPSPS